MQNFTNATLHATTEFQTIYQCKDNEDVSIHNILITNNSPDESITLELMLVKENDGFYCVPKNLELKVTSTLEMRPINMSPKDKLVIRVNKNEICDVVASILQEIRDF